MEESERKHAVATWWNPSWGKQITYITFDIGKLKDNLNDDELVIHIEYSENYQYKYKLSI